MAKIKEVKKIYTYSAAPKEKKLIERNAKKENLSTSAYIVKKCTIKN